MLFNPQRNLGVIPIHIKRIWIPLALSNWNLER